MIARDVLNLLISSAEVSSYIAALVLFGGLVSGVVALGIMQTGLRARIHRAEFLNFFDIENRWYEGYLRNFIEIRGPLLFSLHYRQLAGQLLAIATTESRRSRENGSDRPLIDAILSQKHDRISSDGSTPSKPYYNDDDELERTARWIDLLQGALGRAVGRTVIWTTAIVWVGIFLIDMIAAIAESDSLHSFVEASTLIRGISYGANVIALVIVSTFTVTALAWAVAAASLFTFIILDKIVGAR